MGFHICDKPEGGYVHGNDTPRYSNHSSGDNIICFDSGRRWQFPDAIRYYIYDCGYRPPQEFIDDVMTGSVTEAFRSQTKGSGGAATDEFNGVSGGVIGYLSQADIDAAAHKPWIQPNGFMEALDAILRPLFTKSGLPYR